jgi:hypothetical protein
MPTQATAGFNGRLYSSVDNGASYQEVMEVTDMKQKRSVKMIDATNHNSGGDDEFIPGTRGGQVTVTINKIAADAGQLNIENAIALGSKVKIRFDALGTAATKPRKEAFFLVEDFEESAPQSGLVGAQLTLRQTGAVTSTTQ